MFSQSTRQLVSLMRHTIIQHCLHVENTYVFDKCNIDFVYNKCTCFIRKYIYSLTTMIFTSTNPIVKSIAEGCYGSPYPMDLTIVYYVALTVYGNTLYLHYN